MKTAVGTPDSFFNVGAAIITPGQALSHIIAMLSDLTIVR